MNNPANANNLLYSEMLNVNPNLHHREAGSSPLSFLQVETVRRLAAALERGPCALLALEVGDFYQVVAAHGEDAGLAVLDACLEEAKRSFPVFFMGCKVLAVEKNGMAGLLLFFTLPEENPLQFFNAYASFRFKAGEAVLRRAERSLGQALSLHIGASFLRPEKNEPLDRAIFRAFCEAQRVARLVPDTDHFTLHREFLDILENRQVSALYQPILDFASGACLGWEAFARGPADGSFHDPQALFDFARQTGSVPDLERLCLDLAMAGLGPLEPHQLIFLNVHPLSLRGEGCIFADASRLLARQGLAPAAVVFEFTETQNRKDPNLLFRKLETCREHGFLVAVDDVGAGDSSLRLLSQIRPDFIKADVSLTNGVDANPLKRTMVETLVLLAEKFGGKVIAEGVETETEFSSLVSMGVGAGQGYLFARPAAPKRQVSVKIPAPASYKEVSAKDLKCSTPIRELCQEALDIAHDTLIREVKDILGDRPPMSSMVVMEAGRPAGLLMNYNLDRRLGSKYGVSLYYNRPVDRIMDPSPLVMDGATPVEDVAKAAMNRDKERIYDDIIVVEEGRLVGTVSVQRMLDSLTQLQVELAKGSNPLTGLPGNVAIEQEFERRGKRKAPLSILYFDLDNFKVYNDVYGFNNGDHVIMLLARCLKEAQAQAGSGDDFIGHIGGDDFLVLCGLERSEAVAQAAMDSFGAAVPALYSEEDRARGFIEAKGRDGKAGRFPLVSVSIGILDVEFAQPFTLEELGARAAEIKKFAKSRPGNSMVRDRRTPLGANGPR
jgi:diguanylate cyclase (GGDEF)-like protein